MDASTLFPAGLGMWSLMAFAGSSKYWQEREGPLHEPLRRLKERSALLFLPLPALPLATAIWLVGRQNEAVERMDGVIGLHWMLAAPLGMLGAVLLGAFFFLPVEEGVEADVREAVDDAVPAPSSSRPAAAQPVERPLSRRHPLG